VEAGPWLGEETGFEPVLPSVPEGRPFSTNASTAAPATQVTNKAASFPKFLLRVPVGFSDGLAGGATRRREFLDRAMSFKPYMSLRNLT
jgi:hypothetical protein